MYLVHVLHLNGSGLVLQLLEKGRWQEITVKKSCEVMSHFKSQPLRLLFQNILGLFCNNILVTMFLVM